MRRCEGKLALFIFGESWVDWMGVLEFVCPTAYVCLFKLKPEVLSKTLSLMWGKLNLPMFLFNVGLSTLIKIDSLLFLAKDWKRFQLRDCDYRNHRIFTLKCISKELVPVSIRLKITIKTEKARKIIRKAEKVFSKLGLSPLIVS